MTSSIPRRHVVAALIGVLCPLTALTAQAPTGTAVARSAAVSDSLRPSRWSQPVVTVRYGSYRLKANSGFYRLVDEALTPGSDALRPNIWSVDVAVAMTSRLHLLVGFEHGSRSTGSQSRALSVAGRAVEQRTSLAFSSVYLAGAKWRLAGGFPNATGQDRATLYLQAGAGAALYRLRQSGEFLDANRRVTFGNEFVSSGAGRTGYLGAAVELPVQPWLALTGDWRLQRGSAPMTDDFASFDRLDLGGARASLGMAIFPRGSRRR